MKTSCMVYTIGHSNLAIERFLALLQDNKIEILIDVRSRPVSRFCPHFNKKSLSDSLATECIDYVFLGDKLGGKPQDDNLYDENGMPSFEKMSKTDTFKKGISELIGIAEKSRCAIMCAEEDPLKCHRRFIVGAGLLEAGASLTHIRADGRVQQDSDL